MGLKVSQLVSRASSDGATPPPRIKMREREWIHLDAQEVSAKLSLPSAATAATEVLGARKGEHKRQEDLAW